MKLLDIKNCNWNTFPLFFYTRYIIFIPFFFKLKCLIKFESFD